MAVPLGWAMYTQPHFWVLPGGGAGGLREVKICSDFMFVPRNVMRVTGQSPLLPHGLHFRLLMTLVVLSSCCLRFNLVLCFLLASDPKEAAPVSVLLSPRSLLKTPFVTTPESCFLCSKAAAAGQGPLQTAVTTGGPSVCFLDIRAVLKSG